MDIGAPLRKLAAVAEHRMRRCDCFVILDHVEFERQNYQNRVAIKTLQGQRLLVVPVQRRSRSERIIDKHIENSAGAQHRWSVRALGSGACGPTDMPRTPTCANARGQSTTLSTMASAERTGASTRRSTLLGGSYRLPRMPTAEAELAADIDPRYATHPSDIPPEQRRDFDASAQAPLDRDVGHLEPDPELDLAGVIDRMDRAASHLVQPDGWLPMMVSRLHADCLRAIHGGRPLRRARARVLLDWRRIRRGAPGDRSIAVIRSVGVRHHALPLGGQTHVVFNAGLPYHRRSHAATSSFRASHVGGRRRRWGERRDRAAGRRARKG